MYFVCQRNTVKEKGQILIDERICPIEFILMRNYKMILLLAKSLTLIHNCEKDVKIVFNGGWGRE